MKVTVPYLKDFVTALKQLVTISLPITSSGSFKDSLNWFPVVGLLVGLIGCSVIELAVLLLPNSALSGIATSGAIAYSVLLYYLNKRRNLNGLLKASKQLGASIIAKEHDEFSNQLGTHLNLIVIIFIFFTKIVVTATLIYYGHILWLVLVPLFSASCLSLFYINAQQQELKISKLQQMMPWLITLVFAVTLAQTTGFAMGVVVWFLCHQAFDIVQKKPSKLAQNMVFGTCELLECITLFGGLLLLTL